MQQERNDSARERRRVIYESDHQQQEEGCNSVFQGRETEYNTTVLQQWFTGKRSLAIPDAVLLSTFTGENNLVQDTTMLR